MRSLMLCLKKCKEFFLYAFIGITTLLVFTFLLGVAVVSGNSMNDTYQDGDVLFFSRLGTPEREDVVICEADVVLIKRVIGVAGDTIDIKDGTVIVNGEPLSEPYIKEPTIVRGELEYPVTVPENCYFVMGDNRNHSRDSRTIGCIREEQIQGKVLCELL